MKTIDYCSECPHATADGCGYPGDDCPVMTEEYKLEMRKAQRANEINGRPDYGARCAIKRKLAEANDCRDIARAFDSLRRIFDALSELYILGGGLEFYEREQYNFFTIYESLLKSLEEVIRNEKQDERH